MCDVTREIALIGYSIIIPVDIIVIPCARRINSNTRARGVRDPPGSYEIGGIDDVRSRGLVNDTDRDRQ